MSDGRGEDLLLVVDVGGRRCALRASEVVEVHRAVWVSPLPRAPAIVEGVIDVRGQVVPVIDLHRRFGLPPRPMDVADHLVGVVAGSRRLALHVGREVELRAAQPAEIDAVADIAPHARGVARLPDGLVMIHDVEDFLWPGELALLDAALAERQRGSSG